MTTDMQALLVSLSTSLAAHGRGISGLCIDSRMIAPDMVFLAYPGAQVDGRDFVSEAIQKGASAILFDPDGLSQTQITNWEAMCKTHPIAPLLLSVSQLRSKLGDLAAAHFQYPSQQLNLIGITGTNGKTSCSTWLAQALNVTSGQTCGLIGTLGYGLISNNDDTIALRESGNTTPDALSIQEWLAAFLKEGASHAVMEVSSHALDQGRVNGLHFTSAIFTNLSRDHLDYHGDMQRYGQAKQQLFEWPDLGCAIINADDAFGRQLISQMQHLGRRSLSYGLHAGEILAHQVQLHPQGLCMQVSTPEGECQIETSILGAFNAYNLLAVLAGLLASGISLSLAAMAVSRLRPVLGRMQQVKLDETTEPVVIVDYAHTPDALQQVLNSLRQHATGRLICVMGCGGNRDRGKRPLMGKIASTLADVLVVTSDNPREESAEQIASEILAGVEGQSAVILDRAEAIHHAITTANRHDVVLIAGKGHEQYQEIAGVKIPFSDVAIARQALLEVTA